MSNVEINLSYTDQNGNLDASTLTAVNALIGQGGGGSGLTGIYVASAHGLAGNGTTDDGPALQTLANTTLSSGGTIFLDPGKTFRIATLTTIPKGVTLWAPMASLIKVDGVVLTIKGAITAGIHSLFQYANGGSVLFSTTNDAAGLQQTGQVPCFYPQWWGATGDGSTDDTAAINNCVAAVSGLPTSGASLVRYAAGKIVFPAGVYNTTDGIQATCVTGLSFEGSGQGNTYINFVGGEIGTATAGGTNTLTNSAKSWTTDKWANNRWECYIYGGTGTGQFNPIESNTGTVLTCLNNWTVQPDATSQYAICARAVFDLDGFFTSQMSHMTIQGSGYYKHGIKYYRRPLYSARGSSQGRFLFVTVNRGYLESAWQLGGFDETAEHGYQADLADFYGCQGFGNGATSGLYALQRGWRFGDGTFANALNFSTFGCESVSNAYGLTVSETNLIWVGGTIQSSALADIALGQGNQGYAKIMGVRSEDSRMLLDSSSSESVGFTIEISDYEFNLNSFAGTDLIALSYGPAGVRLSGIRTIAPTLITGTATAGSATTLTDSSASFSTATVTYQSSSTSGLAGWDLQITGGTGVGQRTKVTSNTATQLTFPALAIALDATSQYQIMPRPRINVHSSGGHIALDRCYFTGVPLSDLVQSSTGHVCTWHADGYAELDANGVPVTRALGERIHGSLDPRYAGGFALAGSGLTPDVRLTRLSAGVMGVPALTAGTLTVAPFGTTPTGLAQGVGGSTTYNYKLVAVDGAGNKALASATFSTTTAPAVLGGTSHVALYTASPPGIAAVWYDVLKDDGTGTFKLLQRVPWYQMSAPFYDIGQALTAYTLPVSDATGVITIPDGSISERAVAPNVWPSAVNSGTTQTATWTQVNQKFLYTATGNCTYTIASIPNGGSMLVVIGTGAGSFTATFAAGSGLGSLRWDGGSPPTLTTTPSKYDTFLFEYNGVYLAGRVVGQAA